MRLFALLLCLLLPVQASALEIEAPPVPEQSRDWMPRSTSLEAGLEELLSKAVNALGPDLKEASRVCLSLTAAALLVSVLTSFSGTAAKAADLAGTVAIAALMLLTAGAMVPLAADTVVETGSYGKLLLGVLTAALAAQGAVTTSAALYGGTALFLSVLQSIMGSILVPGLYLYLGLCVSAAATGTEGLKKLADLLKGCLSWMLKTMLIIFTSYLSLTHVVSGATDAAALKAARVGMSSFIPVVGGILSDASEAVLVGAGVMKNAAGIYGILAVLAICLGPFLRISAHYLLLKLTAVICSMFASAKMTSMMECFSSTLGLLLGMTGAGCIMVLISTVCFLKGAL